MKRIIRYFADISGVTEEIRKESYKWAGINLQKYATNFNPPSTKKAFKHNTANALYKYAQVCLNQGANRLSEVQAKNLTKQLDNLREKRKSVLPKKRRG